MHQARIIMTSYPNEGRDLKRLIMGILKQQLGSCVQRINYVKAYYIWEGEIQKTEEKILMIKTTSDKEEKLIEFIKKNHPYELPEIMSIHPDKVDDTYLAWLNEEHPLQKKEPKKDHPKKDHAEHADHKDHKRPPKTRYQSKERGGITNCISSQNWLPSVHKSPFGLTIASFRIIGTTVLTYYPISRGKTVPDNY